MKNRLMKPAHKLLLIKREVIERAGDILETVCDIDGNRHRSPLSFMVNSYAVLVAYSSLDRKLFIFI